MFRTIQVPQAPAGGPPSPGWAPAGVNFCENRLEEPWKIHGTSMEHLWNIYGKSGKMSGFVKLIVFFDIPGISWDASANMDG